MGQNRCERHLVPGPDPARGTPVEPARVARDGSHKWTRKVRVIDITEPRDLRHRAVPGGM